MKWSCPSDKLAEAKAALDASFSPAPEEALIAALHSLRIMVRGREGEKLDAKSMEIEFAVWVRQLRDYPADVAVSCIQDWSKTSQWWPTWFEMREQLERGVSQRRVMRHVVNQLEREAPRGLEAKPESDERRAQVVDEALRKLAEATSMGPFKADKPVGETVSGRTQPSDADRAAAQAHLATFEQTTNERFSLSPMALKAIGITPPKPPEEDQQWHTDDPLDDFDKTE